MFDFRVDRRKWYQLLLPIVALVKMFIVFLV